MKYHGEYDVLPAFVEGGTIKWQLTGNGEFILGKKGTTTYFIKRNLHVRYPTRDLSPAVFEAYKATADAIQKKQLHLRAAMKGLEWSRDRIVVEEDNFWDDERMFVTVTACVPDPLPSDFKLSSIPRDRFISLARDFAARLQLLHSRGVIHGDLKEKNVLVKAVGGDYQAYLIDFDSSYLTDEIPAWDSIGGTDGYQSPEVMLYASDEGASEPETVTPATDIFTWGIVLHRWWCDAFPTVDLERGSVGAAVYLDKSVTIDKKFNVQIGTNCGATLLSLINWAFAKDPAKRPTAAQLVAVLDDELEIPEEYQKGSDVKPFDKEAWPAHARAIELYTVATLKKKGVKSFKRVNVGWGSSGLKYRVLLSDGTEKTLTPDELVTSGYARRLAAEIDEPWPEHIIEFESPSVISERGYVQIKRARVYFRNRYMVTMIGGREFDKGYEWLISEGLAHPKKLAETVTDTPWPEHGSAYVAENMLRLGIKQIARVEIGGERRYKLTYEAMVDGKPKVVDKVSANNMKLMGLIK